ncbi:MAG: aldolase [Acidocella sp. 20-57-95]|nr:MAG: aldolase [Acidocella sp. 20-57-95]HQT63187.1 class II aldolase/adducin family protein [Acidocella sp.]HQU05115.1 class II aldolase/adducin family protein [Acidocella sp.]
MDEATKVKDIIEDIVAANRILAAENVVDAFGHVSARHPTKPGHYFLSRALPPELITAEDIMEFTFDGKVLNGDTRKPYLEKDIHGALYEARPDVKSVVHNHSRSVIPYTVTNEKLRPIVHSCATIGCHVPVWDAQTKFGDTNLLISNMEMGRDFAKVLADNNTALMRGHGCTVIGRSVREAVYTAVYLEVNAGLQMQATRFPPVKYLTDGEIKLISQRLADAKPNEGYDRAWEYWCRHAGVEARYRTADSV